MTLLPASDFGIRGVDGKPYTVSSGCSVPNCGRLSVHTHHLWPRSFLRGQPYEWVLLPDGTVIGNRTGLCVLHHSWVTGEIGGHRARIKFEGGVFWWVTLADDRVVGPLDPQPPGANERPPEKTAKPEVICPTCGHHKKPKPELPPGPARRKKTWTVMVPADAEDGAEVLNTIVEDLAVPLGAEEWKSTLKRYYVLVAVLGWTLQHRDEFVGDIAESLSA